MRYLSLTRNINPILREHLFKKEVLEHCTSSAKERTNILTDYFDFLANILHLESAMTITEDDIRLTDQKTIIKYENFLYEKMLNKTATVYVKLSYIRIFYEDFIASDISATPMTNPFAKSSKAKFNKTQQPVRSRDFYLSFLEKIGGAYAERDKLMVALMLTMGLTVSDICCLNTEDIIEDNHTLWLRMTARTMPIDLKLLSYSGPIEIIPPMIPVNKPTEEWLKTWLPMRPETIPDINGNPLFLTKYKKRLKDTGVDFILKNHAEKQNLDSKDFHPALLRRFAIQNYLRSGGDESGLRDFFGLKLFTAPESGGNMDPFLHNPVISEMQ